MVPKPVKIAWRASWIQEFPSLLYWFICDNGWTIWKKARRLIEDTKLYQKSGTGEPILVVGDSLAAGVGASDSLTKSAAALIGGHFQDSPLINLGANGKCIADVLKDFSGELPVRFKFIIIIAGTMDMIMNTPAKELERDLRRLFTRLSTFTSHVILIQAGSMAAGPRFQGYPALLKALAKRSDRVHELFERVTWDYPHVHYMGDLFSWSLLESTISESKRWFSPDGFHPSKEWHQKVFQILKGILEGRGVTC